MAAETAADRRFAGAVDLHEAGFASIAMTALLDLPQPVWRLAMRRLIMAVGGADYGPSSGAFPVSTGNNWPDECAYGNRQHQPG